MSPPAKGETASLLTQIRRSRNLSLETVASAVGTGKGNLRRIENGDQVPKRETARKLFEFYEGAVPLGYCYDPTYDPPDQYALRM
jgi:transcriptional regulator with XRE-family HTH domain